MAHVKILLPCPVVKKTPYQLLELSALSYKILIGGGHCNKHQSNNKQVYPPVYHQQEIPENINRKSRKRNRGNGEPALFLSDK